MTSTNSTAGVPLTLTHAERFDQFDAANPEVYSTLVRLAREWVTLTGSDSLGIAALYERTRWEIAIRTDDPEFKLNNNHKTFYARKIMRQEPDLAGLFKRRSSPEADRWDALHKHGLAA